MSRIYFHTTHETAEVYGTERAYIGQLCVKFAAGIFDMLDWEQQLALLPNDWRERIASDRLGIVSRTREQFRLFVESSGTARFADGTEVFATVLNTVLRLGSDPMRLAARIHGQCELHGFIEPEDGPFIARLIEQGLEDGVFRKFVPLNRKPTDHKAGWEDACQVLRSGKVVVTSYSVCDSFPNGQAADWEAPICKACLGTGEPNSQMKYTAVEYDHCTSCDGEGHLREAWYDLPKDEQWRLGVAGVRESDNGLRWDPRDWQEFYFGSGMTALDYIATQHVNVALAP